MKTQDLEFQEYLKEYQSSKIEALVLVIISLGLGLAYFGYQYFTIKKSMPGLGLDSRCSDGSTPNQSGVCANGSMASIKENYVLKSSSTKSFSSSGSDVSDPSATATATSSVDSVSFPLTRQTGADLHIPNAYVKNLQLYLNKFRGANLDPDGAFGLDTETAVQAAFGVKQVTRAQYNDVIAPAIGKA